MKILGSPTQRAVLRHLRALIDNDPLLTRAFESGDRHIPHTIVENIESDDWASLTFVGQLHRFDFRLTRGIGTIDAIRTRLDALLAAADIAVPGHIVAEIAVVAIEARGGDVVVRIEALTLEE